MSHCIFLIADFISTTDSNMSDQQNPDNSHDSKEKGKATMTDEKYEHLRQDMWAAEALLDLSASSRRSDVTSPNVARELALPMTGAVEARALVGARPEAQGAYVDGSALERRGHRLKAQIEHELEYEGRLSALNEQASLGTEDEKWMGKVMYVVSHFNMAVAQFDESRRCLDPELADFLRQNVQDRFEGIEDEIKVLNWRDDIEPAEGTLQKLQPYCLWAYDDDGQLRKKVIDPRLLAQHQTGFDDALRTFPPSTPGVPVSSAQQQEHSRASSTDQSHDNFPTLGSRIGGPEPTTEYPDPTAESQGPYYSRARSESE
jgi:hypothetical protein